MQRLSAALLAFVCSSVASAQAQWSIVSTSSEFASGHAAEHRHVVMRSERGAEATLDFALFSTKNATLRVIDDASADNSLGEIMSREHCLAGTNGGYFDLDYAPVGLLVSDNRVVAPLRKARLLSGVVSVVNGRVQIQRVGEFSMKAKPTAARQCGPFLVERGKAIAGLNANAAARRTFVAVNANERVVLGYCSAVTLQDLAQLLASLDLKIERALNLDGGSSSGFWFAGESGVFSIREQKTVRDYIGVTAK